MSNIYYDPDKYGLEILDQLEPDGLSYEFDYFIVWRDPKTREMFYAQDSGCSCPTPFEDYSTRESLSRLDRASFAAFEQELLSWCSGDWRSVPLAEKRKLISDVKRHLPRKEQSK